MWQESNIKIAFMIIKMLLPPSLMVDVNVTLRAN